MNVRQNLWVTFEVIRTKLRLAVPLPSEPKPNVYVFVKADGIKNRAFGYVHVYEHEYVHVSGSTRRL
jgi:hypothetical protein